MQPLGIDIRDEGNTFWQDFSIADMFGELAIQDTYDRCQEWKSDATMWAKFCIVLNHKSWQWAETDETRSNLYVKLWLEAHNYALRHFKGDNILTYLRIVD